MLVVPVTSYHFKFSVAPNIKPNLEVFKTPLLWAFRDTSMSLVVQLLNCTKDPL